MAEELSIQDRVEAAIEDADAAPAEGAEAEGGEVAAPEAGAEGGEGGEGAEGAERKPDKVMPVSAHVAERQKLQKQIEDANARADAERERRLKLEGRTSVLEEQQRKEPAKEPEKPDPYFGLGPRPDPEEEPVKALEWDEAFKNKRIEAAEKRAENAEAIARQASLQQELVAERVAFEATAPDYRTTIDTGFKELVSYLTEEVGMAEADARGYVTQQFGQIALGAKQRGKSAASAIYKFAKRLLKDGGAAAAAPAGDKGGEGEGKPAGGEQRPADDAATRLETAEKGNKVRSLGGSAEGAIVTEPKTLADVDSMDRKEFNKWYAKPGNKDRYRRMLGGE